MLQVEREHKWETISSYKLGICQKKKKKKVGHSILEINVKGGEGEGSAVTKNNNYY